MGAGHGLHEPLVDITDGSGPYFRLSILLNSIISIQNSALHIAGIQFVELKDGMKDGSMGGWESPDEASPTSLTQQLLIEQLNTQDEIYLPHCTEVLFWTHFP